MQHGSDKLCFSVWINPWGGGGRGTRVVVQWLAHCAVNPATRVRFLARANIGGE